MTKIELLDIVETPKEFKGMLWGQRLKVLTDHKNLIQEALGLTSDHVHRWSLLLEEFGPEIVHIKGIQNTVADAISRLDFNPVQDKKGKLDYVHKAPVSSPHAHSLRRKHSNNPTPNKHGVC